ncbi:hypothetical protein [Saccharothrix sp. HUAS TT1]|uniref:hypothetical protein n=1 Tax=unclassified Saccharothrix TaxID=2593673 RepID=UPI00345C0471
MKSNVLKKSVAVLVSGAALFLTLGAGCENEGGDNEDRPGVEQQDEQRDVDQDGDQGDQGGDQDDQGGDQDGDN